MGVDEVRVQFGVDDSVKQFAGGRDRGIGIGKVELLPFRLQVMVYHDADAIFFFQDRCHAFCPAHPVEIHDEQQVAALHHGFYFVRMVLVVDRALLEIHPG